MHSKFKFVQETKLQPEPRAERVVENESVESDGESLLSKIGQRIQDCGLKPVHSNRGNVKRC
jgi:hypothetical protein